MKHYLLVVVALVAVRAFAADEWLTSDDATMRVSANNQGRAFTFTNVAQVFWTAAWPGTGKSGVTVKAQIGADSGRIPNLYPGVVNYIRLVADNGTMQTESEEFVLTAGPARPGLVLFVR